MPRLPRGFAGKKSCSPQHVILLERGPSGLVSLSEVSQKFNLTQREREVLAKGARHLFGGTALDQVSAQRLVLAVFREAGFQEEAAECTYFFWCAYSH